MFTLVNSRHVYGYDKGHTITSNLNCQPSDKIINEANLKAFADDKTYSAEKWMRVFGKFRV